MAYYRVIADNGTFNSGWQELNRVTPGTFEDYFTVNSPGSYKVEAVVYNSENGWR